LNKLLLLVIIGGIGASTSPAWAMEVQEGFDLFMTTQTTFVDLSSFNIPGVGIVPLEGDDSLIEPGIDTIVERLDPAGVPDVGNSMTVDIELVALSLVSVDPVDIGGDLFDIHVIGGFEFGIDQMLGSMEINRDVANGGSFSAILPVAAEIEFIEVGNPSNVEGPFPFADTFRSNGVWSHTPAFFSCFADLAGGFFPGVDPITKDKVPTIEEAALARHTVIPCMRMAVGGDIVPLDTTMVLVAGAQYTAAWMIPVIVSGIGFGLLIQTQKTRLKLNSCPSCKSETDDTFQLGENLVGKCKNSKCKVSLFFVE